MRAEDARVAAGDDREGRVRVERLRIVAPRQIERPAPDDVVEEAELAEQTWLDRLEEIRVRFRRERLAVRRAPRALVVRVADQDGARPLEIGARRVDQPLHLADE